MSTVSLRALPGSSILIYSKDLSLDVSTLKFRVDQSGPTPLEHRSNGAESYLNVSCETAGPLGMHCLRISIEGHVQQTPPVPELVSTASYGEQTGLSDFPDKMQWNALLTAMSIDSHLSGSMSLSETSHCNRSTNQPEPPSTAYVHPSMLSTEPPTQPAPPSSLEPSKVLSAGVEQNTGSNGFDFDWSNMSDSSTTSHPDSPHERDPDSFTFLSLMTPSDQSFEPGSLDLTHASADHAMDLTSMTEYGMSAGFAMDLEAVPTVYSNRNDSNLLPSPPESYASLDDLVDNAPTQPDNDNNNKDRPFPCRRPGCTSRFIREYTRKLHEKTHRPKPMRVFSCSEESCNVKTSRRHDLLRHEVRKHGRKSDWQCESCDTFFSSAKTQERHTCPKKAIRGDKSGATMACWKLPR